MNGSNATAFLHEADILSVRDTCILVCCNNKYGTPDEIWIPFANILNVENLDIRSGELLDLEVHRWVLEEKGFV